MHATPRALFASLLVASGAGAAEVPATVQRPTAAVYAAPSFDAQKLATLKQSTVVSIAAQQGLWYQLTMPAGPPGFVRVNDVRLAYANVEDGAANVRVLMEGKAGKGRVTETAGVRGIDESDLKSAAFNQAQLDAMIGYRADPTAAAAYAREHGWQATSVAYAGEARTGERGAASVASAAPAAASLAKSVGGLLGALGSSAGAKLGSSKVDSASKLAGKSETDLAAEELALGPQITGRVLGARPLWNDAQCRAARQPRWTLGRLADQPPGPAMDLRHHRHARSERFRGARRLHPADARPVRTAGVGRRAGGGARPRDQSQRTARSLQCDPQAATGVGRARMRRCAKSASVTRRPPRAMRVSTPRRTAPPSC